MVDDKKRRFLKHLGLVGGAGVVGLAVAQLSTEKADRLVDNLETAEHARAFRRVWATAMDRMENAWPLDRSENFRSYEDYLADAERLGVWYCALHNYVYDVTAGRRPGMRFDELPSDHAFEGCPGARKENFERIDLAYRSGGKPWFNHSACAYHFDEDWDGEFEASEEGVFCTMPCKSVCPVDAIEKREVHDLGKAKVVPHLIRDKCIGCGRCHKICGYNCIEWDNSDQGYIPDAGGGGI